MSEDSDEEKAQNARDDEVLASHARRLMEHFGAVQIFVSRYSPEAEATWTTAKGFGDYNTRYGMVCKWLNRVDAEDMPHCGL